MHKNPFVPQPSYPQQQQPSLPPGPPPAGAPDYSAYWAAQQYPHQQQWSGSAPHPNAPPPPVPPAPSQAPTADQSKLYANYGYGGSAALHWQQQQHHHQRPPPPPPPLPQGYPPQVAAYPYPAQPGYYVAPIVGAHPGFPPQPHPYYAVQAHPPAPHVQTAQPPQQHMNTQRHNHGVYHTPPQQLPPAKRQRFDGPTQQPHARGGAPFQQSTSHNSAPQIGPQVSRGGIAMRGIGRGGSMNAGRGASRGGAVQNRGGGLANGRGRGGSASFVHSSSHQTFGNDRGRGGPTVRGQNSRGSFNRRGGSLSMANLSTPGNANSTSFRARGARPLGKENTASDMSVSYSGNKKDENRRTLTDFKIIGLEIADLHWSWGLESDIPKSATDTRESTPMPSSSSVALLATHDDEVEQETSIEPQPEEATQIDETQPSLEDESNVPTLSQSTTETTVPPPPSRVRIYFHTPVSPDESHYVPHLQSQALQSTSDVRKGKRKKSDEDDEDNEEAPAKRIAPLIDSADEGSVTASERDWVMGQTVKSLETDLPDAEDDRQTEAALSPKIAPNDDDHVDVGSDLPEEDQVPINAFNAEGADAQEVATSDPLSTLDQNAPDHAVEEVSSETDVHTNPPLMTVPVEDHTTETDLPHVTQDLESQDESDIQVPTPAVVIPSTSATIVSQESEAQPSELSAEDNDTPNLPTPDLDHLPEPPVSPASNTLLSTSSGSTYGGDASPELSNKTAIEVKLPTPTPIQLPLPPIRAPSANRISISYAGGSRRLVVDASVVDRLRVFREQGRIEVSITLSKSDDQELEGIFVEGLCEATGKTYLPIPNLASSSENDPTIPSFGLITSPQQILLTLQLDKDKPLSEPKWVKSGDVQEWLRSILGRMFWVAGDADNGWEKKIEVVDPDPPPTIWTVLEHWVSNSPAGTQLERQRFHTTHLNADAEHILEILLRLVRGDRATPFPSQSASNVTAGPLKAAVIPEAAHDAQQSYVSLAVLAIARMAKDYALKSEGDQGKKDVEEKIGELIRCLPQHLVMKSLDGMFKEWKSERKS